MNNTRTLGSFVEDAKKFDESTPQAIIHYRSKFARTRNYFGHNSLGLRPAGFTVKLAEHSRVWQEKKHNGHFHTDGNPNSRPWWKKQEQLCPTGAKLIGCSGELPTPEIGFGNGGLSVNTRLLLEDFLVYIRETKDKQGKARIMTIGTNFPSDDVGLKASLHTVFGKHVQLIEVRPHDTTTGLYDFDKMIEQIRNTPNLKMGFFPGLCYRTGQRFPIERITEALHEVKAVAGFDLAHSVGNYQLSLHNWGVDFATFPGYKYLNGGPGCVSGFYIHEKWFSNPQFPTVSGWFGIHEDDRFNYDPHNFRPAPGAWRKVLSNDPIFNMLGLEASFEAMEVCGIENIFTYHKEISSFLYECLKTVPQIQIITPENWEERGCQISFRSNADVDELLAHILKKGFCEKRGKDTIRITAVASNSYTDVANLVTHISEFFS